MRGGVGRPCLVHCQLSLSAYAGYPVSSRRLYTIEGN